MLTFAMKRRLLILATAAVAALSLVFRRLGAEIHGRELLPADRPRRIALYLRLRRRRRRRPSALPYQYSVIGGSLPPGLSLSKGGQVSGTPAQAGRWSFWST